MRKNLLFTILLTISIAGFTQVKYSNEFLAIGVGARALGMSGAQAASVDDETAGYWNPAGLAKITHQYNISYMHSEYFAGIAKYDYAAFATKLDTNSYLGATFIRFGIDDIPDTRFLYDANGQLDYNRIRSFSAADYAFLLSYAKRNILIPGLNAGANVKLIYRGVGQFANAWGFGLDAGAQYERKGWRFGAVGRDITGTFNAWSFNTSELAEVYTLTGNEIPRNSIEVTNPRLIIGAARYYRIREMIGILGAIDLETTFDGKRNTAIKTNFASIDPRFGVELDYIERVYLRFGAGNIQKMTDFNKSYTSVQPNFGVGLVFKILSSYLVSEDEFSGLTVTPKESFTIRIDYALTNLGGLSESLYSHVISARCAFNL